MTNFLQPLSNETVSGQNFEHGREIVCFRWTIRYFGRVAVEAIETCLLGVETGGRTFSPSRGYCVWLA
jgi:hypothetical protein